MAERAEGDLRMAAGGLGEGREPYVLSLGHWSIDEIERAAEERLGEAAWSWISDVAEDGLAARRERRALDDIVLRQRVLVTDGALDTSTALFGQSLSFPVLAAPTSAQGVAHPEGEVATVEACAAAGTIAVVSGAATRDAADIAAAGAGWWRQIFAQGELGATLDLVEESVGHGAAAIMMTADVPVLGRRRNLPGGYVPPGWRAPDATLLGRAADVNLRVMLGSFTWDDVSAVRGRCPVPLLVKGILDGRDARRALDAGADGIVVSTHGGRQLDAAPAPAEVLPEIRDVLGGDPVVLADGGVRRGSHVLRLLARGATAVLVGRPTVWGLACGGSPGVRDVLEILRAELVTAMALTGCRTVSDVTAEVEWRRA